MERISLYSQIPCFLEHLEVTKGISAHTRRSYYSDLIGFFDFWEKREQHTQATIPFVDAVTRFRSYLLAEKTRPSTVARKMSCYNTFMHFLAQQEKIEATTFVRPAVSLPAPQTISTDDFQQLMDIPTKNMGSPLPHRDRAILAILYATGARCSELSALQLDDVATSENSITIKNQRSRPRTIPVASEIIALVKTYLQNERATNVNKSPYLFLNYRTEPLTTRSIQRICTMFGQHLQPPRELTPQILRNTFATMLADQGADIAKIQYLLGHSARLSTERYVKGS